MIFKIARFTLQILIIFVLAVYLPQYYWKIFEKRPPYQIVLFSPTLKKFVISEPGLRQNKFYDTDGYNYNRDEYEQLLPLYWARHLFHNGTFPDSIDGKKLEYEKVIKNNFFLRIRPSNIKRPQIQLFPLLESQSGRLGFELPEEYFRINKRIEFINAFTNSIDDSLSKLFTEAMQSKDFKFPAKFIFGNPATRKPFDEGYFVVDSKNGVFHLKMIKGKPFCVKTPIHNDLQIEYINVRELNLKEFYGILVTEDNKCFLISYDNYNLIELPGKEYQWKNTDIRITGNIFYRNIAYYKDNSLKVYATDRYYRIIDTYEAFWPGEYNGFMGKIAEIIFPYTINLRSPETPLVGLYTRLSYPVCSVGIFLSLLIFIGVIKYKNEQIGNRWFDLVIILLSGLYGLFAVLSLEPIHRKF